MALGVAEAGDPFGRGREGDALAGEAGADPERDREVRLAGPGRAEQDDVVSGGEEVELAEVQDERLLARERWKLKSNSSSVLRAGKRAGLIRPSPPCASREATSVAQQRLGEALVAPLLGACALGQLRQRPGGGRRLQRAEQVGELGLLCSCGISAS